MSSERLTRIHTDDPRPSRCPRFFRCGDACRAEGPRRAFRDARHGRRRGAQGDGERSIGRCRRSPGLAVGDAAPGPMVRASCRMRWPIRDVALGGALGQQVGDGARPLPAGGSTGRRSRWLDEDVGRLLRQRLERRQALARPLVNQRRLSAGSCPYSDLSSHRGGEPMPSVPRTGTSRQAAGGPLPYKWGRQEQDD